MQRKWWWGIVVLALVATTVSWAAGAFASVSLTAKPASSLPGGRIATVIPLSHSLTLRNFSTEKPVVSTHGLSVYQGQELYKVVVGDPAHSNELHVQFFWSNPAQSRGVLRHGWLIVGLYYPAATGPFRSQGGTRLTLDWSTLTFLNAQNPDVILMPSESGVKTFYVLVNVINGGGVMPPGQQQTANLQFYCQVVGQ